MRHFPGEKLYVQAFSSFSQKKTLLTHIITMDVGRESDNDDAVDGFFKEWT